ncbi:MAG: AAA family ATPase [Desulfocapsaceae bacterium]|nr:AAA family ATPase [Desulfocapsaceae bacterium]
MKIEHKKNCIQNSHYDSQRGISVREILYRIFSRFYLFLACLIIVPLLVIYFAYLIPPQYEATTKILIRHNDTSSFSESNRAASQQTNMSSQSIVEILTSLPVCERVVQDLDIKSSDIAKPAYKILMGYMARVFHVFSNTEAGDQAATKTKKTSLLAKELKGAISPKITDKGQAGFLRDDELIEVNVRSFNQQAVAGITNKLGEEFINEYYRIFEEDAQRTYQYLNRQIAIAEGHFGDNEAATTPTGTHANEESILSEEAWADSNVTMNPIVDRTSRQIAELEKELYRLRTIYSNNSSEVKQMEAELAGAKQRLKSHKNQESTESILNILKENRRQAYMTLQIYKNKLIPISIVEKAITPVKSPMLILSRYLLAGGIGLVAGLSLGFTLIMFLGAIDNRLYTPWDIEKISDIEIIGSITEDKKLSQKDIFADITQLKISNAIIETLGMLELKTSEKESILMVAGAANNEGKTAISLQLACAMAHDQRARVLLIDANFNKQDLTNGLLGSDNKSQGIIDVLTGQVSIDQLIQKTAFNNLDFLPAGNAGKRESVGFYRKSLHLAMDRLRQEYDLIIIDTPGLLKSMDAALFAAEANHILMVIKAGVTRRETFLNAQQMLSRADDKIIGAILNFRNYPVPRMFYGQE